MSGDARGTISPDPEVEQRIDPRVMLPLCVAAFLGAANVLGPAPFFTDQARDLDSTVPVVGQAITIALFTAAVVGMAAGPLADHFGHRRLLLGGLAAIVVSTLGTALAPTLSIFLGSRLLAGIGSSIGIGVSFGAAVSLFGGRARRRSISLISAALSVATGVGPLALTTVATVAGWRGAFALLSALALVALVAMWMLFPSDEPGSEPGYFSLRRIVSSYIPIIRDRAALRLYGVWALRSVCWIGSFSFLGAFFTEEYGYSTQAAGVIYLLAGSGYFVGTVLAGGRLGDLNLTTLSAGALTAMGLGWLSVFALSPAPAIGLPILFTTAIGSGIAGVTIVTLVAERTFGGPATSMVLTETVLSFGAALGGATGGLLLGLGGFIALGLSVPLAGIAGALLVFQRESEDVADNGRQYEHRPTP